MKLLLPHRADIVLRNPSGEVLWGISAYEQTQCRDGSKPDVSLALQSVVICQPGVFFKAGRLNGELL